MYGLLHEALREVVIAHAGEDAWTGVALRAGSPSTVFIMMRPYPDALLYSLLDESSRTLRLDRDTLLERVGEQWALKVGPRAFGDLFDMCGGSFRAFLDNLQSLHTRMQLACPHLRPPQLAVEELGPAAARITYLSEREGLAPLVVGLLKGLAARFKLYAEVTHTRRRASDGFDELHVRWVEAG